LIDSVAESTAPEASKWGSAGSMLVLKKLAVLPRDFQDSARATHE
jgi:hypothetical protein